MDKTINATFLRVSLPEIVKSVRRGEQFTVTYRSRTAFRIVPVDDTTQPEGALEPDSLLGAPAVGRSRDRRRSANHDEVVVR